MFSSCFWIENVTRTISLCVHIPSALPVVNITHLLSRDVPERTGNHRQWAQNCLKNSAIEDEAVLWSCDRSMSVSKKASRKTCVHKYPRKRKNVPDCIHHQGWCAVAFAIHLAGHFSRAYSMQIRNQTEKMKNTFTRESDS